MNMGIQMQGFPGRTIMKGSLLVVWGLVPHWGRAGGWLDGIDWVVLGGESGPGARPLREEWVVATRDQ